MVVPSLDFPFPDGKITYDCHACGYQCCSGLNTELFGDEVESLLSTRPELAPFVSRLRADKSGGAELTTFGPRCFLLKSNGDCSLESDGGREAKPWVCRLYPVNDLSRIGGTVVFNFHVIAGSVICPFRLEPGSSRALSHGQLTREIATFGEHHPVWKTARRCPDLDKAEARVFADETRLRGVLWNATSADPRQTLALACELSHREWEYLAAMLSARFGLPWRPGIDSPSIAAFAPGLRMSYLTAFPSQGYDAARRHLPTVITLGLLYAQAAARLSDRPLAANLWLLVVNKLMGRLHLASLLDEPATFVNELTPRREPLISTPETLGLYHRLNRPTGRKLWEVIGEAMGRSRFSAKAAVPFLGALEPLASSLVPAADL